MLHQRTKVLSAYCGKKNEKRRNPIHSGSDTKPNATGFSLNELTTVSPVQLKQVELMYSYIFREGKPKTFSYVLSQQLTSAHYISMIKALFLFIQIR